MIEELLELGARPLLKALYYLARVLVWLLWELLCETLCWYLGWPVVKVLTLGLCPSVGIHEQDRAGVGDNLVVMATGLIWPLVLTRQLAPFA
ncbi:hypothetical protein [Gallaecimonas sp. GXIMD4217]|uniref:hypothetical protein n=1 Tax=Gallaecimonas sp. GXIMD4217 TaxID=3131927 RepID=UPI00311AE17C